MTPDTKAHGKRLEALRASLAKRLGLPYTLPPDAPGDDGDVARESEARTVLFASREQLYEQLRAVDAALDRIPAGTFGTCLGCSERIPPGRLRALPWADRCVPCAVAFEQQRAHVDRPPLTVRRRVTEEPGDGDGIVRRDVTPADQALSELTRTDDDEGRW